MVSKAAARLAEKLKPRTELGMSTAELAEKMGVSWQAVSQWLKGDNLPRAELMLKLEQLTGITMQEWLVSQDEPEPEEEAKSADDGPVNGLISDLRNELEEDADEDVRGNAKDNTGCDV